VCPSAEAKEWVNPGILCVPGIDPRDTCPRDVAWNLTGVLMSREGYQLPLPGEGQ